MKQMVVSFVNTLDKVREEIFLQYFTDCICFVGFADWSTWARGQSWAVHGYTVTYRYTKYQPFLEKAIGAVNYVLTHLPNISTDLVTYWDFDAPHNSTIPYQPRDTSAAAILASGLIELSEYVTIGLNRLDLCCFLCHAGCAGSPSS